MMARDEAYAKTLSRNLDRILELQKFAEAKNASLLAFSSVWVVGLVNLLASDRHPPPGFRLASVIALGLFMMAAMTAIVSLVPRFVRPVENDADGTPNMLFFGDIAHESVVDFAAEARRRYFATDGRIVTDTLFIDLSRQIAVVSRISMRKYRLFNRAATAALVGIATFTVPIVGLMVDSLR